MRAVLITGNPKYINNAVAVGYYEKIIHFLKTRGVEVILDPGDDYTCPPVADFYIGHSRGAGRIMCFDARGRRSAQRKDFLMFGDPDGYIHPVDRAWQEANPPSPDKFNPPPKEHFEFYAAQQQAIVNKIREVEQRSAGTRQSPGKGRPSPRG
jgi:hypothetical protein